jgi:hypothetical protein
MPWPWLWSQRWSELLFLHWPVDPAALRPLIPTALDIERFDGTAWVAVAPFRISRMRFRGVPLPPFGVPEMNVRTYVTDGRRSGVWFLSLDAASRFFVLGGRALYHLPYVHADIRVRREGAAVHYSAARPDGTTFRAAYQPAGAAVRPEPGSFDRWCVERYCLYAGGAGSSLRRADISHRPWDLMPATVALERNDMLAVHGLSPAGPAAPPRMALPLDVVIWPPTAARRPRS